MKACPTCQRTYADDMLTYCLIDGSILSAPYDPQATIILPSARVTDPAPTQPSPPAATQPPQPPPPFLGQQQHQPVSGKGSKSWKAIGIAMSIVSLVAVAVIVTLVLSGKDKATDNRPIANTSNTIASPSATPTPTPYVGGETGWGPIDENASINEGERITYYRGTTPERCQADCDENPKCQAFTYIREGAYNQGDPPMCYLMSYAKELSPSPCCISAMKIRLTPLPSSR